MAKKNKSLKIAQFHWGFPPIIGGVETHLTILLPEMVKMGHKVDLLTGAVEGAKVVDRYKGVGIYRVPIMQRRKPQEFLKWKDRSEHLTKRFKKHNLF